MKRTFGILAILTLLLSACGRSPTAEPSPSVAPSPSAPEPTPTDTLSATPEPASSSNELHLLVGIEGKVELKRQTWNDYHPTTLGARLWWGDLLFPDGVAKVLCADLSLHPVRAESGLPCPRVQDPVLVREGVKVRTPRKLNELIPYVLRPRDTKVLTSTPLLRWNDTGAGSYTVVVRAGGHEWKQEGVTGSEMRYPTDAPSLTPGVRYLLMVIDEDTGRSSTEDPSKGLGFDVLSDEQRGGVAARAAEIDALDLDEPTRQFVLATYYAGQELRGEALALLDGASGALDTPAIHLWRGDLLRQMSLSDEATTAYQVALERAQALGDEEGQAIAHAELWWLTGDQDHVDRAVELFEKKLGDTMQAEALRGETGR